jgi:hypothetical protein
MLQKTYQQPKTRQTMCFGLISAVAVVFVVVTATDYWWYVVENNSSSASTTVLYNQLSSAERLGGSDLIFPSSEHYRYHNLLSIFVPLIGFVPRKPIK